jgi:hypothetical protein
MVNTETIIIKTGGEGTKEALIATENLGQESGLGHKEIIRLRLLAEELVGLMRGITAFPEASFWAQQEGRHFEIHLEAYVDMHMEMRKQLLAASSSGTNAAAKGFMGRLRDMINVAFLPEKPEGDGMGRTDGAAAVPVTRNPRAMAFTWSLSQQKAELASRGAENSEAWDELEKSIVANLADEVSVNIVSSTVEITIFKTF